MRQWKGFAAVFAAGILMLAFTSPAISAPDNQKTTVTFKEPVEVPGMVLPAGDYVFEVAESPSSESVVEIRRAGDEELLTTVLAIPNKRLTVPEDAEFVFYETAPGTPPALCVWFYPSFRYGHELVYPEPRATELAQESRRSVPSSSDTAYTAKPDR
jgi:hypothetical protein